MKNPFAKKPQIVKPEDQAPDDDVGTIPGNEFVVGKWYKAEDETKIMLGDMNQVMKHSVIRFEVVKIAYGVVAVRFEDGSFEAFEATTCAGFKQVKGPMY